MPNKPRKTAEAQALTAAINAAEMKKAAVAAALGVSPGLVSQWASGRTPVPPDTAPPLAQLLGLPDPGTISARYRKVAATQTVTVTKATQPADLKKLEQAVVALEAETHELRAALLVMAAVMKQHRPAEAAAAAAALHRQLPAKQRETGLLARILKVLE
ncbi:MAG: hypothetical protein BGP10_15895 [Rhodanobacter sp. 68-29]|nr:helix-turn-helix domain-containing protein [Rhodanobacter sp.]ODV27879.1 MAG: hypothetical protein ABT19_01465 [Rhodanobacter sp. SCN 68-63]OJY61388.1 MAG: hypothetical protein BGP10_15895 [Rhodanobacter sp. 68-29]